MRWLSFVLIFSSIIAIAASQHRLVGQEGSVDWICATLIGAGVGLLISGLNVFAWSLRQEWEERISALEARLGPTLPPAPGQQLGELSRPLAEALANALQAEKESRRGQ